ncbi:MAG: threonine synthase, partial [Candidatus Bipolaricaulota bacterium]
SRFIPAASYGAFSASFGKFLSPEVAKRSIGQACGFWKKTLPDFNIIKQLDYRLLSISVRNKKREGCNMYPECLTCEKCGGEISLEIPVTGCPNCGYPLTVNYDHKRIKADLDKGKLDEREWNLFRYRELLPLPPGTKPASLGEGGTPIVESTSLFSNHGITSYFKLEYTNPTGSFKDRGVAMTVSKAQEWGVESVADDSSGNAGAALAGYSAKAGLDCTIYVPEKASGEKINQIRSYGARLKTVPGPRENTARKIRKETRDGGTHYASHNLSPYFPEGMKTIAYEISEQFNWNPPEHVVLPVGGGALLVGIYRGFRDLARLNWIKEVPRLHAIQSEACNPVVRAFKNSRRDTRPAKVKPTVAEGIHMANPERGREILEAIRKTGGTALEVSEDEIKEWHRKLSRREGIFAEPTSAAPVAGVKQLKDEAIFKQGDRVLVPITGFGLKDVLAGEGS